MAKLPERVVSKDGKNLLGSQLTGQNWRSRDHPVPPLPRAQEGRGSLELVQIFQMRIVFSKLRRSVEVDMARARRAAVPAPGGSYGAMDHSSCVWFCLCRPIETTLPIGVWDQQRSRCEARRCEARRCKVRCLGPLLLCVVLLVQANRYDTSDRCLGPAAE